MSGLWVVFAKPPIPGESKTRLAAAVGERNAAKLARAFLADTVHGLLDLGWPIVVATTDPAIDHGVDVPLWDQGSGTLGARLAHMAARGLRAHGPVVLLGADSPGTPAEDLIEVRDAAGEIIVAPAADGGFWALRVDRPISGLLDGVPFSTPTAAADTARALSAVSGSVRWGPQGWDIDTADDLIHFRRTVPRGRAPATHAVLDEIDGG